MIIPAAEGSWAEHVVKLPASGAQWCRGGRFLRDRTGLHAFTAQGLRRIDRVGRAAHHAEPFERAGLGPWLLLSDGTIQPADGGSILVTERSFRTTNLRFLAASSDGNRLLAEIRAAQNGGTFEIDLTVKPKPAWRMVRSASPTSDDYALLLGRARSWPSEVMIRNTFDAVLVRQDEIFALVNRDRKSIVELQQSNYQSTDQRPIVLPACCCSCNCNARSRAARSAACR